MAQTPSYPVFPVVRLTKNANCTASLYGFNDTLLGVFSLLQLPFRDKIGGSLIVLKDVRDNFFAFDVNLLEDVNGTAFGRLDIKDGNINAQSQARINTIFIMMAEQIFRGCEECCDGEGGGCIFDYQYAHDAFSITTGQFDYNASGLLIISPYTYDSQDISGSLSTLTTGSRITFGNTTTKSEFVVFELTGNAAIFSGFIVANASVISGSTASLTEEGIYCTEIDKSSSSGGGSQNWQQTLDVSSVLDKDNSIAGAGFNFEMLDNSSVYLETLAGTANGNLYLDPTTASLETTDSGTGQTSSAYSQIGGANAEAGLVAGDTPGINRFLVKDNEVTINSTVAGFQGIKEGSDFSGSYVAASLVRKSYVDALQNGLSWKNPVLVSTTANITLSGEQTIDGVLTSASRVLVKNQSAATENGLYISAAGAWARSADANTGVELEMAAVFVSQGTVGKDKAYTQTTDNVTIGVSNIVWVQFAGGPFVQTVSGDSADNTDPFNPVVNAIPYDKANQTINITGGPYEVDNASNSGFVIVNGTITTRIIIVDGVVLIDVVDSSTGEQSIMGVDLSASQFEIGNASGHQGFAGTTNGAGIISSRLLAYQGSSISTKIEAFVDRLDVCPPSIAAGTATNGDVLILVNNVTGESEWQTPGVSRLFSSAQLVTVSDSSIGSGTLIGAGIGTLTIAANEPQVDWQYEIKGEGFYNSDTGPGTITLTISLGGVTMSVGVSATLPLSATARYFGFACTLSFETIGATATVYSNGKMEYGTTGFATSNVALNNAGASTVIDTTTSNVIDATVVVSAITPLGGNNVNITSFSIKRVA